MRVSEIRVKRIRVNQGLGVCIYVVWCRKRKFFNIANDKLANLKELNANK